MEEKSKNLPLCPENKGFPEDKHNVYMKKIKPKNYTKGKKLISGWTDKSN